MAAGASAGEDGMFGTADDTLIPGGTALVARIASVIVAGRASGSAAQGDHFGIIAQQITTLRAAGAKLPLSRGPGNDIPGLPVGSTGDLRVREAA